MNNTKNLHKGHYGHIKRYKNIRLIIIFACFAFILADVLLSLIMFQTRRTLFIIVAAIMSIPFAKNFANYLLCFKCNPLTQEEYEKAEDIGKKHDINLLYDISITDDSIRFFPTVAIVNNNIIAYHPEAKDNGRQKEAVKYLENVNAELKDKARICVVSSFERFDKELGRICPQKEDNQDRDGDLRVRLLRLGL